MPSQYTAARKRKPAANWLRVSSTALGGLYSTAFAAIVFLYHSALSLGVLFMVLKST